MDLKNILKNLKLNENNVSMILGAAIIVVIGFLVVNYFKNLSNGTTSPVGTSTIADEVKLPTKHTVKAGESLWTIAETYYKSGYNWVDIEKANKLKNASVITVGQELTIPDVTPKLAATSNKKTEPAIASAAPSVSPTQTPNPTKAPTIQTAPKATNPIAESSYTVVKGDNLWKIATRAYGNGYKWKEIAKANKLKNPSIIHSGNSLTLPR